MLRFWGVGTDPRTPQNRTFRRQLSMTHAPPAVHFHTQCIGHVSSELNPHAQLYLARGLIERTYCWKTALLRCLPSERCQAESRVGHQRVRVPEISMIQHVKRIRSKIHPGAL